MSWTRPRTDSHQDPYGTVQHDNWISDKSKNVTRVTLSGPRASSSQIGSNYPSSLARPSLPQTFELVGRDSNGNEVRYGFKLRKWFVHRGNQRKPYRDQSEWCRSLGYSMPWIMDLTNSNYNNLGATPWSSGNWYHRYIDAGFFTEWGRMYDYADAGFVYGDYWTNKAAGSNQFHVHSNQGDTDALSASYSKYAVCIAP